MSLTGNAFNILVAAFLTYVASTAVTAAQTTQLGCVFEQPSGDRQVLRCQRDVTITAEPGARFTIVDRNGDGIADSARLRAKALLIESPSGTGGFQVITPQAIAAVRGTEWAVDVGGGKTAVFVVRGRVAVRRVAASAGVTLGPGEGVDVDAGSDPLTVRRWPQPRVSALLDRLGR